MARSLVRYGRSGSLISALAASPTVRRGVLQVGQYLGKRAASALRGNSSKKARSVSSSSPITTQYDVSGRYRRKPMPKRKRRAWKRFTSKVKHVLLQQTPLSSYTFDTANNETWAVNQQATFGVMLGGTTASGNDELLQAFRNAYGATITTTNVDAYKLFIKSIVLDVQLVNTGSAGAILDVYTLQARSSDTVQETIGSQYIRLYQEMDSPLVNVPDWQSPATTPFNNGLFCGKWKILNKKEILLGPGQSTTMQMRNPANKTMYGKTIESNPAYVPGYTRAYLFQVRGLPENSAGTARLAAGTLTFARQFSVVYAIPPGSSTVTTGNA